jgi:hypothetical protein
MDALYEWVDRNPPVPDRTFSFRRAAKLFVVVLICGIIAGLPPAFIQLAVHFAKQAEREQERQERLNEIIKRMEQDAQEGKEVGEAFRRLVGIEEPHAKPAAKE